MKQTLFALVAVLFVTLLSAVDIIPGGTVSQDFTIGTSATATLPTGWKVDKNSSARTLGSYSAAATATDYSAGNSMLPTASNGVYNYGAGVASSATDRAVGWVSSSSATKSGNLYLLLTNTSASSIPSFTISYNVEKYRKGTNTAGFSIQMYYSTNGTSWTSAGSDFLTSIPADTGANDGYASAPGATFNVSAKSLPVSVSASSVLYLAWNYSVTTGTTTSNAQALGVDDVTIVAGGSVSVPTIILNPTTLSGMNYTYGFGPSNETSFAITGTNLTGDLTVTPQSNFEVATASGGTFSNLLTYTPSSGSVNATVFVRLKSGLAINSYSQTISVASADATTQIVSVSGAVQTPPPPIAPTATAASAVSQDGFTAHWDTVNGSTAYEFDVYSAGGFTELVNTSFEGATVFPDGWTQNSSYVSNNSAGSHTGTNYAGMNAAEDYFYTPLLASPGTISFWVSASSITANNSTKVQYSANAVDWTDLDTFAANGANTGSVTTTISQKVINASLTGDYYIRWYMNARTGGSQYFDDILITSGSKELIYSFDGVTLTTARVEGLDPSSDYSYIVRAANEWGISANSNEISVTTTAVVPGTAANSSLNGAEMTVNIPPIAGFTDNTITIDTASGYYVNDFYVTVSGDQNSLVYSITTYDDAALNGVYLINHIGFTSVPTSVTLSAGTLVSWSSDLNSTLIEVSGFASKGNLQVTIQSDETLPVELSSFTAIQNAQNYVNLMWTTQSESGVSGYYIYRSTQVDASTASLVSPLIPASNTSTTQSYVYTDSAVTEDGIYYYWLQNVDLDGSVAYHGPVVVNYSANGGNNGTPVIPTVTELKRVYPNPFNPSAFISYGIATPAEVSISIYNNRGQLIRTLRDCPSSIGNHRIEWNGKADNGSDCSSGVYIFKMNAGKQSFVQKAILVK